MKSGWGIVLAGVGLMLTTGGCRPKEELPWTLLELGTEPLHAALDGGAAIRATWDDRQHPFQGLMFPSDTTLQGRIARRDLLTLPTLACGDRLRLHPKDLPNSLTTQFDWPREDSLTVRWECLDGRALATLGRTIFSALEDSAHGERQWVAMLRQWRPETFTAPERIYSPGEKVDLTIVCSRPDGVQVGDTVRMEFRLGETDQVVPAVERALMKAGPGAYWAVWSPSEDAFGSRAHPDLQLPARTPLHFAVEAH